MQVAQTAARRSIASCAFKMLNSGSPPIKESFAQPCLPLILTFSHKGRRDQIALIYLPESHLGKGLHQGRGGLVAEATLIVKV